MPSCAKLWEFKFSKLKFKFLFLLSLTSLASENLSAKCTTCSFKSSTPKFMFEFTSPCKLGSVNSNISLGILETESVKFSPFSREYHL